LHPAPINTLFTSTSPPPPGIFTFHALCTQGETLKAAKAFDFGFSGENRAKTDRKKEERELGPKWASGASFVMFGSIFGGKTKPR